MEINEFIPRYIKKIINRFESTGHEAYAVGGCVRDRLLGMQPSDWDMCTSAEPEEVCRILSEYKIIPTGIKHGTVTVITPDCTVEITTFRGDGEYIDSRHPKSVRFIKSLSEDLKRRDFTINAMAYSERSGIIDLYNGISDLSNKVLRCVGEPNIRFKEDALRIMRALRFSAVYDLAVEEKTSDAMHFCRTELKKISAERISAELEKMLTLSKNPGKAFADYFDILAVVFPEFEDYQKCYRAQNQVLSVIDSLKPDLCLRLCGLMYFFGLNGISGCEYTQAAYSALKHLKLTKKHFKRIMNLINFQSQDLPDTLAKTRMFINNYGVQLCSDLAAWKKAIGFTEDAALTEGFIDSINRNALCCSVSDLAINGRDLTLIGIKDGKKIGEVLNRLLFEVINKNIKNDKTVLLKESAKYLQG